MTRLPDDEELARAVAVLRAGGLVAFPTETVYGLGADAGEPAAVGRIFAVKERPVGHPLIVHLASGAQLDGWTDRVPDTARRLADAFWPGPLTLILPRSARVPDAVTGGRDTVGLRVPDHPVARALLQRFGGGIAAPSANRFGHVSPTTAADVRTELGDDVDLVLDGGPCAVGVESTIVDLTADVPELVRPGGVSVEALADVLGFVPRTWSGEGPARAPGMLPAHYAPDARVEIVPIHDVVVRAQVHARAGAVVAVLAPAFVDGLPDDVVELEPAGEGEEFAQRLYARLRQADRLGIDVLLVVPPAEQGIGVAVLDRLRRAAASTRSRYQPR